MRVTRSHFPDYFQRRVALLIRRKKYFVIRIILAKKALDILFQPYFRAVNRLQNRNRRLPVVLFRKSSLLFALTMKLCCPNERENQEAARSKNPHARDHQQCEPDDIDHCHSAPRLRGTGTRRRLLRFGSTNKIFE